MRHLPRGTQKPAPGCRKTAIVVGHAHDDTPIPAASFSFRIVLDGTHKEEIFLHLTRRLNLPSGKTALTIKLTYAEHQITDRITKRTTGKPEARTPAKHAGEEERERQRSEQQQRLPHVRRQAGQREMPRRGGELKPAWAADLEQQTLRRRVSPQHETEIALLIPERDRQTTPAPSHATVMIAFHHLNPCRRAAS